MKKIISTILVFAMIVTMVNIPFVANAEGFSCTIVDFASMSELTSEYYTESNGHVTVGIGDYGLEFYQANSTMLKPDGTRNGNKDGYFYSGLNAELSRDTANRTVISATQLKGKFDLVLKYKANVDRYDKHPETKTSIQGYYTFNVGMNDSGVLPYKELSKTALYMRVDQNKFQTLNNSSEGKSTMSVKNFTADNLNGEEHTVRITMDTETGTQTVVFDNDTANPSTGKFGTSCDYINAIYISGMERMNEGAYLKIKDIKLENYIFDAETQAIVDALPEKLTDDVNAVSENITLDVIEGVTWTSSNPDVISETGIVTPADEDTDVTITATFGGFTKAYTMTVPKYVAPVIPEEPLPDDVNYEIDFTKLTSFEGTNWKVTNDDYVEAKLTTDGLKLEQIASKVFNEDGTTRNGAAAGELQGTLGFELERDTQNRTVTTVKELRGNFDVIVDYKANVDRYQTHPDNGVKIEGFYSFNLAGATNNIFIGRVDRNSFTTLNNNKMAANTMSKSSLSVDNLNGKEHTVKFSFDTETKTQTVMLDNDKELVSTGTFASDTNYVNNINISGLQRMNVGAYLAIKKIKVANYTIDTMTQSILDDLPEKLVDDVNNVTENISIPKINGVVWSSSNKKVIGEDGKVTRAATDTDVTLTATVNGIEKSYTMTVLKKTVDPDDPILPPAEEGNKLVYDMDEYASYGAATKEWKITNSGTNDIYVENGSLIIKDNIGGDGNLADGSVNSAFAVKAGITFEGIISSDDTNKTRVTTKTFSGKYALEFTYKTNMTTNRHAAGDPTKHNNTYYFINMGYRDPSSTATSLTDSYADLRIPGSAKGIGATPTYSTPYFYHADASGSKKSYSLKSIDHETEVTLRFVFDTTECVIDGYIVNNDGSYTLIADDIPFISGVGSSGIFNAIEIQCQEAYNEGSYIEIKDLKLYEVLPDIYDARYIGAMKAISKMPEKIIDNPDNVTNDIDTIPTHVDGEKILWNTGNPMVLSSDGKITNWVDAAETYLGGSVSYTDPDDASKPAVVYTKKYYMTIPAIEGAETKIVYTGTYDNNWIFGYNYSEQTADHEFTENSLKLEQITVDDPTAYTNKKNYYGILRFNGVEIPYDESSRAEVYSDTFSGVYDLEFDLSTKIASAERPVTVDIGFYNVNDGTYKTLGSVESYINTTKLRVWSSGTISDATEFAGALSSSTNIRLRVDTNINKIWVFMGENLVTDAQGISYYNPLGNNGIVNAMRISMDENLELGDSAEISNIKLTQKLMNEIAGKASLINAANSITVNEVTETPNSTVSIKNLPDSVGSYRVKWSSLNPDIINVQTGAVFGTETANDVWVIAEIYDENATCPINIKKKFKLTVPAASANGVVQYRLNLLELSDYTKQELSAINFDIDLPDTDSFGSNVTWSSSNTNVIGHNGELAEVVTEPTKVILTATLSTNGASGTKDFEITVMPRAVKEVLYTGNGENFTIGDIDNASVYGNVDVVIKKGAENTAVITDKNGNSVVEIDFAEYGDDEVAISIISEQGIYTLYDKNGNVLEDCIPLNIKCDEISAVKGASEVVVSADVYTVLKTALQYINYEAPSAVVTDQTFPINNVLGATVSWTTDNNSVIAGNGELTIPDVYTFVNVKCTVTKNGISLSKTYYLPVPCEQTKNIMLNANVTANSSAEAGHSLKFVSDGNADTYGAVVYGINGSYFVAQLESLSYINTVYISQPQSNINDYKIEVTEDGVNWRTVSSGNMNGEKFKLVSFDNSLATAIKLTVLSADESPIAISSFEGFLYADINELMKLDLSILKINSPYEITGNLTLPVIGKYGTTITWESKNESVISSTGKYTQPEKSTVVTIVASVPSGETKEFKFFAKGKSSGAGATPSGGGSGGGGGGSSGTTSLGGGAIIAAPDNVTTVVPEDMPESKTFNDVNTADWYYNYVKDLKDKGIVNGDDKGNFNPSSNVKREEFVKMLVISAGIVGNENTISFSDVPTDAWYYEFVKAASSAGVVNGVDATNFGIGTNITRQDMAVMIYRVMNANNETFSVSSDKFTDDANISDYAKEAVYAMKEAGILVGSNGKFNPKNALTRAEAAKVISVLGNLLSE